MELFTQNYIENYRTYFNSPNVIETVDKIFDTIKNGNEFNFNEIYCYKLAKYCEESKRYFYINDN